MNLGAVRVTSCSLRKLRPENLCLTQHTTYWKRSLNDIVRCGRQHSTTSSITLPEGARLIQFSNRRRNALSLESLRSVKEQLLQANTKDGVTTLLPDFLPSQLPPRDSIQDRWLWDSEEWRKQRGGLPSCLVIATEGPVFSSGHDLSEMKGKPKEEIKEIFDLCSEVMSLIRRSPSVVISRINGIATAAGAQLAATTDIVIASPSSSFGTPGVRVGLYCTTPGVAVARAFPPKTAFGMLATARTLSAKEAHEKGMVTFLSKVEGEGEVHALDQLVHDVALDITSSGSQIQALGKWSFYTQIGMREGGGDGMEAAVKWAGEIMARNAKLDDAKEGFSAFLEKRKPSWKT